jgi:hypothetical protein
MTATVVPPDPFTPGPSPADRQLVADLGLTLANEYARGSE